MIIGTILVVFLLVGFVLLMGVAMLHWDDRDNKIVPLYKEE